MKNLIIALALAIAGAIIAETTIIGNGENTMRTQATNINNAYIQQYRDASSW